MTENTTMTQPIRAGSQPQADGSPAAPPAPLPYPSGADLPPAPAPRPSLADRLRTPVAGAVLGGVVILGAGFGAGYLVGKDAASSSSSTTDPGGQFGQQGQFGPGQGGFGGIPGQGGTGGLPGQSQGGTGTQGGTTTQDGTTTFTA